MRHPFFISIGSPLVSFIIFHDDEQVRWTRYEKAILLSFLDGYGTPIAFDIEVWHLRIMFDYVHLELLGLNNKVVWRFNTHHEVVLPQRPNDSANAIFVTGKRLNCLDLAHTLGFPVIPLACIHDYEAHLSKVYIFVAEFGKIIVHLDRQTAHDHERQQSQQCKKFHFKYDTKLF